MTVASPLDASDTVAIFAAGKLKDGSNVVSHGARGDGKSDDAPAFQRALYHNAGGIVVAPARPEGYVLRSTLVIPPRTTLALLSGCNQLVWRRHSGTMASLQSGGRVEGGDSRGCGLKGTCFAFPSGTGQQLVSDFAALEGWQEPILDYAATGGSQSRVQNFSIHTNPNSAAFAVRIADEPAPAAVPRHFVNGHFNGGRSFDFGGCSIVMIEGVYCADLRLTDESRGVMMSRSRVGNQRELTVRGHDHVLEAGWMPRMTLGRNADNCVIGGFFNSGPVIDASGNGRNAITYVAAEVALDLSADLSPLRVARPATATLSRTGSLYTLQLGVDIDGTTLGQRLVYINLPSAGITSCPVDQWGTGAVQGRGSSHYMPVAFRVLPADAQRAAILVYRDGTPLDGSAVGNTWFRLTGSITYSA